MRRSERFALIALFTIITVSGLSAEADEQGSRINSSIPMRDGKSLAANVLLPKAPGKYPCVLIQTPYNKDRMGREFGDTDATVAGRGSDKAWSMFDREHYAYCFVDWRGFYGSKDASAGVDKKKWKRGQDGYDAVEWCAVQPWCNGKVGSWGGSALGKQQFDTLVEQPPHLVCAVPLIAYQGQRYEAYYEGGVALSAHIDSLDRLGFGVGTAVRAAPMPGQIIWKIARNTTYQPDKIAVPCLLVSGWWDNFPGDVIEQFNDIRTSGGKSARENSFLVMGPWVHTAVDLPQQGVLSFPDADSYSTKVTLAFFDQFLRGGISNFSMPRVQAYQCGEGWVSGDSWAMLSGKPKTFCLSGDGGIGVKNDGERSFTYDPRSASPTIGGKNLPPLTYGPCDVSSIEKRTDVLVYRTAILNAPLRLRGDVIFKLSVSVDRPDADIHVRIVDDAPDGKSYLINEEIQRLKLRDGKTIQLLSPGVPVDAVLRFSPIAYTWAKGHSLTLIITGGNSPRYERNTQTGDDRWDEGKAVPAVITVQHASTVLTLPVIE